MVAVIYKTPGEILDVTLNWATIGLSIGSEVITDVQWAVDKSALIISDPSFGDITSTIWLDQGTLCDVQYVVTATVETSDGRTLQSSFPVIMVQFKAESL